MARTDIHLDAMLRHLGAAYYEELHGRATHADVTRALDTVGEHLTKEERVTGAKAVRRPRLSGQQNGHRRPGHWKRRVRDVMTTSVVSVDRITPYKEIARLLTEHRISGVPVLSMGRHVVGVVSEADLLAAEDERARRLRTGQRWLHLPRRGPQNLGLTAGELMTAPAVTVQPDTPVPSAAQVMTANHLRRLPVVDEEGKLIGIVTRRDLLSAFLRPDAEIAADVAELLDEVLHAEPTVVKAVVHDGRVILTGTTEGPKAPDREMVPTAIRLIWDIDGVIDVDNRLGQPAPAAREHPKAPHHLEAH